MPPSISHTGKIAELLEPAIDGPPSPESIRAFSNQVRRASDKSRQSHQTTSSGSSSLRSLTSADRPSWDHTFDTAASSLSRQSSGRSISSSAQPRDRHESVQIFGRAFFGKMNRLRRESSAHSSSNSSLYSAENSSDRGSIISPPLPPATSHGLPSTSTGGLSGPVLSKDALKTSFFGRRRNTKPGTLSEDSDSRPKLQISGPYNFQHLAHTQQEQVPNLQRGSRTTQSPTDGTSRGIHGESLYFADFSSEALPITDDTAIPNLTRRMPLRQHAASVSAVTPRPRTLFHTLSQDQLRIPPPRPPRSPIESSSFSPPVPPRMSSRISVRHGEFDPLGNTTIERPRTSGGFRSPTPLALAADMPRHPIHIHSHSADLSVNVTSMDLRRMSQNAGEDANWPLAMPTATPAASFDILPGVPEEEEHPTNRNSIRKSRASVISNSSSLRGSHSVPLLRQLSQAQCSSLARPLSGASDTLGRFDPLVAQRASDVADQDASADFLPKENWEDDIDYCYEHAIEANCNYAWERSSLDLSRDDVMVSGDDRGGGSSSSSSTQKDDEGVIPSSALSPMSFDIPFLSPASQTSISSMNEAVTPTGLTMRRPDLTIKTKASAEDVRPLQRYLHVRTPSHASSFKESHGFNLSPSFFIPGSERYEVTSPTSRFRVGFAIGVDDDDDGFPPYGEALSLESSSIFTSSRTSASTTGSCASRDSVLSRRHISTTSTSTDLSRLTMSTASIEDLITKPETDPAQIPLGYV